MHYRVKINDIRVVTELLQHSNLPDSCAWDPIVTMINLNLLNGDHFLIGVFDSLVHNTVCAFAEFLIVD